MNDNFKWNELKKNTLAGTRRECGITKLIKKVPFQAAVIDDKGRVFTYLFENGRTLYVYLYSTIAI